MSITAEFTGSAVGAYTSKIRITLAENYSSSTNKTTLSLNKIEVAITNNNANWGSGLPIFGSVYVEADGVKTTLAAIDNTSGKKAMIAMPNDKSYHSADLSGLTQTSTAVVTHNNDGTKSVSVGIVGGFTINSVDYFGVKYPATGSYSQFFGLAADGPNGLSKTVSLTARGHTLTTAVSPQGYGAVTSGATLAANKTKQLTATPAASTAQYAYSFSSWSKTAGSLSSTTSPTTTFTMGTSDATVTANFTRALRSYQVTCSDRIGNSSGTELGAGIRLIDYGTEVSGATFGTDSSYDAYYEGYHYIGSSAPVTVVGSGTVVYRYFTENTWTLTYDSNGGAPTPSPQTKVYGVPLTLRGAITKPTYTGYYSVVFNYNGNGQPSTEQTATKTQTYPFKEWNTLRTGTGTGYPAGGTYNVDSDATLYARFNIHEVITGVSLPSATWTGRTFLGWYTAPSGGEYIGPAGGSYTPSGNTTLYAHWSINSFTLTASPGDNVASISVDGQTSATAQTKTIDYGETVALVATLGSNAAYTYAFSGWYSGTTLKSSSRSYSFSMPNGNLSLTAKATRTIKRFTLSVVRPTSGATVAVRRTSSPNAGAVTGALAPGAAIYYGDVLQVSYTVAPGYDLATHTINGATFSSPATVTVTGDVSVVVLIDVSSSIYIYNGSQWERYMPYAYGGAQWGQYQADIHNGAQWVPF